MKWWIRLKTLKRPDIEFNTPMSKLEIKGLIKKTLKDMWQIKWDG